MNKIDVIKDILLLTPDMGIEKAIQAVLKKLLLNSLSKIGGLFSFGPVNFLFGFIIDWALGELIELLVEWVKYQITYVLVNKDFDKLRDAINLREEINKKPNATKEELDDVDQKIRDGASHAFRLGRL